MDKINQIVSIEGDERREAECERENRAVPVAGNKEDMSGAICLYDNMDLTGTSDSEPNTRSLRSSKAKGRSRQSQPVKRRRLASGVSTSEPDELPSQEALSAQKKKSVFLKPRTVDSGEDEIQEMARSATVARASLGICASVDSAALAKQVASDVEVIHRVATKSKNLKGTFARALKDAGNSIKEAVEALSLKFSEGEAGKLQAENACLRREIEALKKEMAELRKEVRRADKNPTPQPSGAVPKKATPPATPQGPSSSPGMADELIRSIMIQVGNMINARLESFEQRLPPEKRLRPPLAAERRNMEREDIAQTQQSQARAAAPEGASTPNTAARGRGRKGKKRNAEPMSVDQTRPDVQSSTAENVADANEWTKVGKGGKKVKKKAAPKPKASRNTAKAARRKLRPPRSAAVVITLQPEAEERGLTYKEVLTQAKTKIDLAGLGVPGVRFRQSATGARVLEVPGEANNEKADSLAQKLRELIPEGIARVTRPTRCADLRIYGLDDSLDGRDIAAAVALKGGCPIECVKVGTVQRAPRGSGTAWVSCPVAAAKTVVNEGRLTIGWVVTRVELLKQRPLRCFKCLQIGHVRAVCTAEIDRSSECYRCGQAGHKAATCSAEPKCSLCSAAGKPANHRIGGGNCHPPQTKKGKKASAGPRAESQPDCPSTSRGATQDKERVNMTVD
ncbi:uncharacterized protein [Maniola hyperantus]|uniref:uncharacterized protein n=1 Tax=Aphantopus hyperantus TaxID=2795564 RepID=UPI00374971EB